MISLYLFKYIKVLFPSNNQKKKNENQVNSEDLRSNCFVSTIVKHPRPAVLGDVVLIVLKDSNHLRVN